MNKDKFKKNMINAMKTLREHYQKQLNGEKSYLYKCPLCKNVVRFSYTFYIDCDDCPWMTETGRDCREASKWFMPNLRNGRDFIPQQTLTKWRKRRIKELTEWIKKWEKEVSNE